MCGVLVTTIWLTHAATKNALKRSTLIARCRHVNMTIRVIRRSTTKAQVIQAVPAGLAGQASAFISGYKNIGVPWRPGVRKTKKL